MGSTNSGDRGRNHAVGIARRFLWWAWFTIRDFFADNGVNRSAALAYITLFALVPLLATVAVLYKSFFSAHVQEIVEAVTGALPFSSDTVANTLTEFVRRATALGGISLVIFIILVFRLFYIIEETLNQIWGVAAKRSATIKIFSFTMILFWGPVAMGLGTSLLLWLRGQPWAPSTAVFLVLDRVLLPLVGFTMVYWLAPHTSVKVASALAGGVTATAGLVLLRAGFIAYIKRFPNINLIFGSLALALIFLISIFSFWVLVIIGAEASYVAQNLAALMRGQRADHAPFPDPVLASTLLVAQCYSRIHRDGQPPSLADLAHDLSMPHRAAKELLDRLVEAGLLGVTGRERERFLPVKKAAHLTLDAIAEAVNRAGGSQELPPHLDIPGERVRSILQQATASKRKVLASVTIEDLLSSGPV
ncbi:MAG: YihY family inner membrane protein [Acidobacteria bacterium]|nr:YihY family inner membrane protein [Acidobacteriota bacterium]